jgi:hypothetical protein
MTRYIPEAQRIFKSIKSPVNGFIVDVVEYPDYLALRVYRDNVESFSEPQKLACAEYLYLLRDSLNTVVKCHIEGVEDAPPSRRR